MNSRLPPPPEPPPLVACRCCGETLDTCYQPGFFDRPGYFMGTCRTVDCALRNYTLGLDGYSTLDLEPYLTTARKKREGVAT